jgi:hypothetical protein
VDKKLLVGGVAAVAIIGGVYYFLHNKIGASGVSNPANANTSALSNTASLLQTNSDATTQLLGGESQVGVTAVSYPGGAGQWDPTKVSPDILPVISGSTGVTGSAPNQPYLTPQQYSTYIATGGKSY